MKRNTLIVLMVALALLLSLTACLRSASTPPATLPTSSTEQPPFPFSTVTPEGGDPVAAIQTQTAQAANPLPEQPTQTPAIEVMPTNTPEGGDTQPQTGDQPTATAEVAAVLPTMAPTPVLERPQTYTLQAGEWPICIARRYGLDLGTFLDLNGLTMNSKAFSAGTVLKIPATGDWSSASGSRTLKAHPASHTIAAGQSIYSIACSYGDVSPEAILAANGLASAAELKVGSTISIP